jgi:recombination protein RecT
MIIGLIIKEKKMTEVAKKETFSTFLSKDAIKKKINEMVGSKDGQRFITSILSVVSNNPAIAECDQSTILSSALLGEALKLSPSPQLGYYYIVPFNNTKKGCKEAQFQLGYKGYIQLAIRSGQYKNINVVAVKQGELINYNPLTEELDVKFIEDDDKREKTETIGYYAMFELTNGFKKSIYWSKKKMLAHAEKYSMGFKAHKGYTFWEKDFDGMAFKTLLRQLISKWGIMSIDIQNAFEKDMGVIREDGSVDYVDNEKIIDIQPKNDPLFNEFEKLIKDREDKEQLLQEWEMTGGDINYQKALFDRIKNENNK